MTVDRRDIMYHQRYDLKTGFHALSALGDSWVGNITLLERPIAVTS